MNIKYIAISLLLAAGAYGSFALIRQMQLIKASCIKFRSYRFERIGLNYVSLIVDLQVKNNSDIDIQIISSKFDVLINDVFISNIKTKEQVALMAHTTSTISLKIEFDPKRVLKGLSASFLNTPENIKIHVKGGLTAVSSSILISNIKIDESITLADILKPGNNKNC